MGLEGGSKKKIERLYSSEEPFDRKMAVAALHAAIAAFTILNGSGDPSQAGGRREASRLSNGLKMEDTIKPGIIARNVPKKDDERGTIKYTIKG